jgi:AcrR family transcriptional regulator
MPRPRKASDAEILEQTLALMEELGSDALTFAALAERTGLSGSTLVQRFGTKQGLIAAAVAHGWNALDRQTSELLQSEPNTPEGALNILTRLSEQYGDIDAYADKLRVLREDLRKPEFRARGHAWVGSLAAALESRFEGAPRGFGLLLVAQWQGALLLWAFSPTKPVPRFVGGHLSRFLETVMPHALTKRGRSKRKAGAHPR